MILTQNKFTYSTSEDLAKIYEPSPKLILKFTEKSPSTQLYYSYTNYRTNQSMSLSKLMTTTFSFKGQPKWLPQYKTNICSTKLGYKLINFRKNIFSSLAVWASQHFPTFRDHSNESEV